MGGKECFIFSLISNALGLAIFILSVAKYYGDSEQNHEVSKASKRERRGKVTEQRSTGRRTVYEQTSTVYRIILT